MPLSSSDPEARSARARVKTAYVAWVIGHARLLVDLALAALTVAAALELWEWLLIADRMAR